MVRTLGSQPRNTGSTPVGAAFASNPAPAGFCVKIGYNGLKSGANPNPAIETLIKISNTLSVRVNNLIICCPQFDSAPWDGKILEIDIYLVVGKEVPGADNVTLSSKLLIKVMKAISRKSANGARILKIMPKAKSTQSKNSVLWYATYPKCAKKYGKNCTVIIGKI